MHQICKKIYLTNFLAAAITSLSPGVCRFTYAHVSLSQSVFLSVLMQSVMVLLHYSPNGHFIKDTYETGLCIS